MDILSLLLIATGLAMDAFAVAVTNGFTMKRLTVRSAVTIALFFGGFQGVMPLLGWAAGLKLRGLILSMDHWVAFGLLFFIGSKMIYESLILKKAEGRRRTLTLKVLLFLSLATSVDALAIGFSFSLLNIGILFPALVIGLVTFFISLSGVVVGKKFGFLLGEKMESAGGLILIIMGFKILLEHLQA